MSRLGTSLINNIPAGYGCQLLLGQLRTYGIILVFFLAFVWLTCRKRKALMHNLLNDVHEDFDNEDDLIPFNQRRRTKSNVISFLLCLC